jgi:hypothetical protein
VDFNAAQFFIHITRPYFLPIQGNLTFFGIFIVTAGELLLPATNES